MGHYLPQDILVARQVSRGVILHTMGNGSLAKNWDDAYVAGRDFTLISGDSITQILAYLPKGSEKTCLDIGCGTGQLSRELYHRGFKVLGVDASSEAICIAKERSIATPPSDLDYKQLDIEKSTISKRFSLITCKLVYAFIKHKSDFLEKIARTLEPNGIFVIITPLDETTPPEKQAIAVNHQRTMDELSEYFTVNSYEDNQLGVYICKHR